MDVFLIEDEELLENIRVFGIEPAKLLNKSLIVKLSRKPKQSDMVLRLQTFTMKYLKQAVMLLSNKII